MRVMYIAPRYHTNQIPIIKGWIDHGDQVNFVARHKGPIEDYSDFSPVVVSYSPLSEMICKAYTRLYRHNPTAFDINLRLGFPRIKEIKRIIDCFDPELVILREKSLYSIICYSYCRKKKIKTITYNQSPLYLEPSKLQRNDIPHRIVDHLMPRQRYTPVRQKKYNETGLIRDENAFFAPFVCILKCSPSDKQYFIGNCINVLMIGRFDRYKNHLLMIDAFHILYKSEERLRLRIVGECDADFRTPYYEEVISHINELGLEEVISVDINVPYARIGDYYKTADLYVLPSTYETAGVSIIEAMGYSVPVISSSTNGTADYIEDGENGYIFESDDVNDLADKMKKIIGCEETVKTFGAKSYQIALSKYQFSNYYDALIKHI